MPPAAGQAEALARLKAWDRTESRDSAAGAIFIAWYSRIVPALVIDDLGESLYHELGGIGPREVIHALSEPTQEWCDDRRTTTKKESCDELLARTLDEALELLRQRMGTDPLRWRLDKLLTARFENRVAGELPLLRSLFNRSVEVGGDSGTVRVSGYSIEDLSVRMLSGFFADIELAPGRAPLFVETMGQAANPLSTHFDDLLADWSRTHPRPLEEPSGADEKLRLDPL
jgi:acyl-homoserine lactone acylase PvdQ